MDWTAGVRPYSPKEKRGPIRKNQQTNKKHISFFGFNLFNFNLLFNLISSLKHVCLIRTTHTLVQNSSQNHHQKDSISLNLRYILV